VVYPVLLVILIAGLFVARAADRLVLWPTTEPMDATGLDQVALGDATLFIAREPRAELYVLRLYGNADRAEPNVLVDSTVLSGLLGHPVEVWGLDYPGYGPSTAMATLGGIGDSALAAFDAMRAAAHGKRCYIVATSIGTTGALHVAAERNVDGLVLQNPPPLRQLVWGRFGWWNAWLLAGPIGLQVPSILDSLANARRATAPAIFVLSGKDEVVPPAYARRVYDAYAGPKHEVAHPEAPHNVQLGLPAGLARSILRP
jgi:pimeloyl-ACP methyl ester carboxylesterase